MIDLSQPSPLPKSLWAATARPAPDTPPMEGERRADIVVVGAGFTGLSATLHLAERGADVVLLEAAEPGWGASGRNGGQVIPGFKLDPDELIARFGPERGERVVEFAGGTADLVFDLIERHGIDCTPERSGWIQAVHAPSKMALAERRVAQWSKRGVHAEVISATRIAQLTGSERYAGGWIDSRGGMLQPLGYARGLAASAQTAGAAVHGRSPAVALRRDGTDWRVETPGGAVTAKQVLLATNAYTDQLWPGLRESVIPVFSYQVATRPLSDNLRRSILAGGLPVADTRRLLLYFRLDPEGRLIVGGRGRFRQTEEPRFYDTVIAGLNWLYPRLGDIELDYYWAGQVAITLDHMPHLHEPAPGLFAMLGYNGRGVAMATACGKLLAERMGGTPAEALPLPVAPLRRIPLHGLRQPALAAAVAWKRLLDRWESRQV